MPERMDGGDAILEALRNLDVDYIISSPGSEWPSVWEALARQAIEERPGPTYINCWHETLAVAMASGYTRMTGRMQAVLLHAGVGVLQGSMGIHGAYQSEVPMLVCSGESATYGEASDFDPGPQWLRNLSIVGGPNRLVEPFTKWSSRVTSPETLYETVSRAGELAQRTPKGPSFLNIPMEVMREEWKPRAGTHRRAAAPRSFPDPDSVEQVAELIRRSSNPVISTGSAGRTPEGFNNLLALAESLSIPVFESEGPSCANFPKSHPLHRGYDLSRELERYDLFLVVGDPAPWYPPSAGPANATVVVIDEYPIKEYMVYQDLHADHYLEGDLPATLAALTQAVGRRNRPGVPTPKLLPKTFGSATGACRTGLTPRLPSTPASCATRSTKSCPPTPSTSMRPSCTGDRSSGALVGTTPSRTFVPAAAWARVSALPSGPSWRLPAAQWPPSSATGPSSTTPSPRAWASPEKAACPF